MGGASESISEVFVFTDPVGQPGCADEGRRLVEYGLVWKETKRKGQFDSRDSRTTNWRYWVVGCTIEKGALERTSRYVYGCA